MFAGYKITNIHTMFCCTNIQDQTKRSVLQDQCVCKFHDIIYDFLQKEMILHKECANLEMHQIIQTFKWFTLVTNQLIAIQIRNDQDTCIIVSTFIRHNMLRTRIIRRSSVLALIHSTILTWYAHCATEIQVHMKCDQMQITMLQCNISNHNVIN